jgi:hypothetical protein
VSTQMLPTLIGVGLPHSVRFLFSFALFN